MAFDLDKVQALLRLVTESGVAEIEMEEEGTRLVIRRNAPSVTLQPQAMPYPMPMPMPGMMPGYPQMPPPPAPQPAAQPAGPSAQAPGGAPAAEPGTAANEVLIRAPIVGTFYRAPAPDEEEFVKEGSKVGPEDTLCIIEAMKLMNEIKAEVSGTVKQILVQNAEPVEYDQPLFVLEV